VKQLQLVMAALLMDVFGWTFQNYCFDELSIFFVLYFIVNCHCPCTIQIFVDWL